MEYLQHGDLGNYINGGIGEDGARMICAQLLDGLAMMHRIGFTHRDLKPQNIFVVSADPVNWWVKIGDFGISKRISLEQTALRTQAGTQRFQAPEILGYVEEAEETSEYTNVVDIWSLGCVAHVILTDTAPFATPRALINYCSGRTLFSSELLQDRGVSVEGRRFVEELLNPHPSRRPAAVVASRHAWLQVSPSPTPNSGQLPGEAWQVQESSPLYSSDQGLRQSGSHDVHKKSGLELDNDPTDHVTPSSGPFARLQEDLGSHLPSEVESRNEQTLSSEPAVVDLKRSDSATGDRPFQSTIPRSSRTDGPGGGDQRNASYAAGSSHVPQNDLGGHMKGDAGIPAGNISAAQVPEAQLSRRDLRNEQRRDFTSISTGGPGKSVADRHTDRITEGGSVETLPKVLPYPSYAQWTQSSPRPGPAASQTSTGVFARLKKSLGGRNKPDDMPKILSTVQLVKKKKPELRNEYIPNTPTSFDSTTSALRPSSHWNWMDSPRERAPGPVFGCSLTTLFERDASAVPSIVLQCIQAVDMYGLEVEGIYRISGTTQLIERLKKRFDDGKSARIEVRLATTLTLARFLLCGPQHARCILQRHCIGRRPPQTLLSRSSRPIAPLGDISRLHFRREGGGRHPPPRYDARSDQRFA